MITAETSGICKMLGASYLKNVGLLLCVPGTLCTTKRNARNTTSPKYDDSQTRVNPLCPVHEFGAKIQAPLQSNTCQTTALKDGKKVAIKSKARSTAMYYCDNCYNTHYHVILAFVFHIIEACYVPCQIEICH